MDQSFLERAERPSHVPEDLVQPIDIYYPPGIEHGIHKAWTDLKRRCDRPVVWTPLNGGHWIVLSPPDIYNLYADHENLSNAVTVAPRPKRGVPLGAVSYDPPMHRDFRMLLIDGLSMKSIRPLKPVIRQLAANLIEGFAAKGQCQFISEFAAILPLSIFLKMVDIDLSERERLAEWAQQITHPSEAIDYDDVVLKFWNYLRPIIERRRLNPGDDMISRIATGTIDGRPITELEALGACTHLMIAGLDTVAAFLGFVLKFLAEEPDQRRLLRDNPTLIGEAAHEFLRRFPLVTMIRLAAHDFEIAGVRIKRDDLVALPTMLFNLSDIERADPFKVDFEQPRCPMATFGNGIHRCPGSSLTIVEVQIVLEEWLARIPEFALSDQDAVIFEGGGVGAIKRLNLRWDHTESK